LIITLVFFTILQSYFYLSYLEERKIKMDKFYSLLGLAIKSQGAHLLWLATKQVLNNKSSIPVFLGYNISCMKVFSDIS